MKGDYTISRLEILHALANGRYHAGGFVPEDAWRGVGSCCNFLEVGAADTAGVHAQEQLSGACLWNGNGFQAHVIHTAIHRRQHG